MGGQLLWEWWALIVASGCFGVYGRRDNRMTAAVLYDQHEHVVIITLNRPEALNAINRQLRQELTDALRRYDQDGTAQVAILTGAGRAFCAGRDLKERAADNAAGIQARASDSLGSDTLNLFPRTEKPLIAAING